VSSRIRVPARRLFGELHVGEIEEIEEIEEIGEIGEIGEI
jgi:hypothetical protein